MFFFKLFSNIYYFTNYAPRSLKINYLSARIVNGSGSAVVSVYNGSNFVGSLLNIPVSTFGTFNIPSSINSVVNQGNSVYIMIDSNNVTTANQVLVTTLGFS